MTANAGLGKIKTSERKEISLTIEIPLDVRLPYGTMNKSENGLWLIGRCLVAQPFCDLSILAPARSFWLGSFFDYGCRGLTIYRQNTLAAHVPLFPVTLIPDWNSDAQMLE